MQGKYRTTTQGNIIALKNRLHDLEPLFAIPAHERFSVRDLEYDRKSYAQVMDFWISHNGGEIVGTIRYQRANDTRRTKINEYKWNPHVRKRLVTYREKRDTLPCGHRTHIYNSEESDGYDCRYCDETRAFSRDLIRELDL